jgi:anti-sigma factor RsiW
MDCARIDLVGYHLGTLDDERELVEKHLLACTPCLEAYLALKRDADQRSSLRPSPQAYERLRRDVAATFAARRSTGVARWLTRPVPLYAGVAAFAVVAIFGFVATLALHGSSSATRGELERVDTSRSVAESLSIY